MILRSTALAIVLALAASPALAQVSPTPTPTPPATPAQTEPRETIEGTLSQDRTIIAIPALATASAQTVAGLRTDSLYWGAVRVSQVLSIALFVVCALLLFFSRRGAKRMKED